MGLKEALRKAAGLLVEMPAETPADATPVDDDALWSESPLGERPAAARTRTVDEIVREAEGPNLDQISAKNFSAPPVTQDGKLDFASIYAQAGVTAAGFTAEQMLDLLASLPQELPLETKRQTMRVTLTALGRTSGASPETVVADASRKLAALHAYAEHLGEETTQLVSAAEKEIAALQLQIEEKRKGIQTAKLRLAEVTHGCDAEADRLDDVLEFFSLDVEPSRYAAAPGKAHSG